MAIPCGFAVHMGLCPPPHKVDNHRPPQDQGDMLAAIPFPDLSPNLFAIELFGREFALRWYALAYIAGILIAVQIFVWLSRRPDLWGTPEVPYTKDHAWDFMAWMVIGIILGGRIGYVVFYEPAQYLADPLSVLQVWNGGMAFHGGFAGTVVAAILFARKARIKLSSFADAGAIAATPGLMFGRLANFVNAELWGHETTVPWGVIFPGEAAQTCSQLVGACARHPSQLYEAALEGALLFLILAVLILRFKLLTKAWKATAVFLLGYGSARFFVEFFRQADSQFITLESPWGQVIQFSGFGMSMGQVLSVPMIVIGLWLLLRRSRVAG
jgi:phosphatidylglycerol---prolipoprotein diacylglyceryl transferase